MSTQPASSRSCWRSAIKRLFAIAAATTLMSGAALADSVVLDPASDGSLYVCAGCNVVSDDAYVLVSGYIQGAIKFSSSALAGRPVSQAFLTLNPYGLPLWDLSLDVYGYGTAEGALVEADADAGTFLGTWILPFDLGYGEDALFDVTSFLMSVSDPYIAFNLRSDDTDVFSSLEYNYGHPSQLLVTFASPVPEPASWTLIVASVLLLMTLRRAKARSPGPRSFFAIRTDRSKTVNNKLMTLVASLLLLGHNAAWAEMMTQSLEIVASDFEWQFSGPQLPAPPPTLEIGFSLTFEKDVAIGPTTAGLTVSSFNLPYAVGGYYYTGASDTLVLATEPIFSGCLAPADTFCIFIAAFSTPNPIVYLVQQVTSAGGFWTALSITSRVTPVTPVPEPATLALLAFGVAGLGVLRSRRVKGLFAARADRAPSVRCRRTFSRSP